MADDLDETPTEKVKRLLDELENRAPSRARPEELVFPNLVEDPLRSSSVIPDLQALMSEVDERLRHDRVVPDRVSEVVRQAPLEEPGIPETEPAAIFPAETAEPGPEGSLADIELPEPDFAVNFAEVETAEMADEPAFTSNFEVFGGEDDETGLDLEVLVATIDADLESSDAETQEPKSRTAAIGRYLLFGSGRSSFAVSIDGVTELGRPPLTTPLPNVPGWLRGVANLRGDILAVADLEAFLYPGSGARQPTRLIVVKDHAETLNVGLLVDEVLGIRNFSADQVTAPTAPIASEISNYLDGCLVYQEQLITILDLDRLLPAMRLGEGESST